MFVLGDLLPPARDIHMSIQSTDIRRNTLSSYQASYVEVPFLFMETFYYSILIADNMLIRELPGALNILFMQKHLQLVLKFHVIFKQYVKSAFNH